MEIPNFHLGELTPLRIFILLAISDSSSMKFSNTMEATHQEIFFTYLFRRYYIYENYFETLGNIAKFHL